MFNRTQHTLSLKLIFLLTVWSLVFTSRSAHGQTEADSLAIQQAALDYIESQHQPNAEQMQRCLHPRLVKRTFWLSKSTGREYIMETTAEGMIITAEAYNKDGNRFPSKPKKIVKILDVAERTASVKLIADDWIDYMHLVKIDGKWKVINVLWQYNDVSRHQ